MARATRTDQANDDLADLLTYLGRQSQAAAARARAAIERAARLLARSPGLGRPRPDLWPDLRSYPVLNTYIIYYRETDQGIEIVRVLHGSRQVDPSMFDD
jgi:toxin ParE1/3/4